MNDPHRFRRHPMARRRCYFSDHSLTTFNTRHLARAEHHKPTPMIYPTYVCSVCGNRNGTKVLQSCKREIHAYGEIDHCAGTYQLAEWWILDSVSNKYWAKDCKTLVSSYLWAGVFRSEELNKALSDLYGTTDNASLALRCTVLPFRLEEGNESELQ